MRHRQSVFSFTLTSQLLTPPKDASIFLCMVTLTCYERYLELSMLNSIKIRMHVLFCFFLGVKPATAKIVLVAETLYKSSLL